MKFRLALLVILWIVLAAAVLLEINRQGVELYYPVLLGWLGGLVSSEIYRLVRKDDI